VICETLSLPMTPADLRVIPPLETFLISQKIHYVTPRADAEKKLFEL